MKKHDHRQVIQIELTCNEYKELDERLTTSLEKYQYSYVNPDRFILVKKSKSNLFLSFLSILQACYKSTLVCSV